MTERDLYLAAYDIADPRRLRAALALAREYATGGQKSVFECFLSAADLGDLLSGYSLVLDERDDRFLLIRIGKSSRTYALGMASAPDDGNYFYVG